MCRGCAQWTPICFQVVIGCTGLCTDTGKLDFPNDAVTARVQCTGCTRRELAGLRAGQSPAQETKCESTTTLESRRAAGGDGVMKWHCRQHTMANSADERPQASSTHVGCSRRRRFGLRLALLLQAAQGAHSHSPARPHLELGAGATELCIQSNVNQPCTDQRKHERGRGKGLHHDHVCRANAGEAFVEMESFLLAVGRFERPLFIICRPRARRRAKSGDHSWKSLKKAL